MIAIALSKQQANLSGNNNRLMSFIIESATVSYFTVLRAQ